MEWPIEYLREAFANPIGLKRELVSLDTGRSQRRCTTRSHFELGSQERPRFREYCVPARESGKAVLLFFPLLLAFLTDPIIAFTQLFPCTLL